MPRNIANYNNPDRVIYRIDTILPSNTSSQYERSGGVQSLFFFQKATLFPEVFVFVFVIHKAGEIDDCNLHMLFSVLYVRNLTNFIFEYNITAICQQDGIKLPGHSGRGR